MSDDERVFFPLRLLIELIFFVNVVEFVQQIFVTATREATKKHKNLKFANLNGFHLESTYLQESSRIHNSPVGFDSNK